MRRSSTSWSAPGGSGRRNRPPGRRSKQENSRRIGMKDTVMPEARLSHAWKIQIAAGRAILDGDLAVPENPRGAVLFAHGSGSSRHSPRNRAVAQALNAAGLATLLLDLLTRDEDAEDNETGQHRFDIPRLADRIVAAAEWLKHEP